MKTEPDRERIAKRIAELRRMNGERASDIWAIRSEISWLQDQLGCGR